MMKQLKLNRLMLLAPLCAAGVAAVVFAAPAPQGGAAQALDARPPRIAVVNPSRIFNEMKETKALNEKMNGEMAKFEQTRRQKAEAIEQLKRARNDTRPDHPQYEDFNNQL